MKAMSMLLVAVALGASNGWGAELATGPTHTPTPIPPFVQPYDAVGRIENARRTRTGTGFLIGSCTVLTAYHVLFAPGETPSTKTKFTFALGHEKEMEFSLVVQASPVLWGNFSYSEDTPTEDFAVLTVPSCPGQQLSPIPLAAMSLIEIAESGGKLRNAGYPVGRSKGRVWGDEDCTVGGMHPLEPDLFAVDCYSMPGMSGGPVLAEKDGQLVAVAIMSRAVDATGSDDTDAPVAGAVATDLARYNEALPVSAFIAKLGDLELIGR